MVFVTFYDSWVIFIAVSAGEDSGEDRKTTAKKEKGLIISSAKKEKKEKKNKEKESKYAHLGEEDSSGEDEGDGK